MNARGKSVDTTYLSIDSAEDRGFIHRDYIAHCLRWTHVVKRMYERNIYRDAVVMDVGCGRELPLAKLLYSSKLIPTMYIGIDYGPVNDEDYQAISKTGKFPNLIYESTDFMTVDLSDVTVQNDKKQGMRPNIVTCFEVLEHVEPKHMIAMLRKMQELADPKAQYFISTPCWNEIDCAANHVNEMKYEALGAVFEALGFEVVRSYGTFASQRDIMPGMSDQVESIFHALREYYDSNFLSCVFAPLYPSKSRNALWELRVNPEAVKQFKPIHEVNGPWSSSTNWKDMAACI